MSRHLRLTACALTGPTALAVAGCSSNSKPTAGAGHPANAAPAGSNPNVGATAGGGSSANPDQCEALKVADAQPLVKSKLSAAVEGNLGCAFPLPGQGANGDNLTVSVYRADTDKKYYGDLTTTNAMNAMLNPVSGVGDTAVWYQVVTGAPPVLVAHGGTTTCEVGLPADTSDLTIGAPPRAVHPSARRQPRPTYRRLAHCVPTYSSSRVDPAVRKEKHNTVHRLLAAAAAVTVPALLLSACSGGSASGNPAVPPPADARSTGSDPGGGAATGASAPAGTTSQMRMRVVNLFAPKNAAGPALDIYDVQLTGQQAKPVSTNIGYGSTSAYFTPHQATNVPIVQLYALPAGEDPVANKADAQNMGGAQDDGSHPQITWVLIADTGGLSTGPLAGLSFGTVVEKGTDNGGKAPVAPPAPPGKGELLLDTRAVFGVHAGLYLLIDTSCDEPLNGDPADPGLPYIFAVDGQQPVSSFALFAATPGSHQVSLVSWTSGTTPTCAQLTAKQGTTSVDVTAGQQIEAYVYGTSATDVHLALAPIEQ